MKIKTDWPTLEGRLENPLTSELEALEQLSKTMPLTEFAKKRLEELRLDPKLCKQIEDNNDVISEYKKLTKDVNIGEY